MDSNLKQEKPGESVLRLENLKKTQGGDGPSTQLLIKWLGSLSVNSTTFFASFCRGMMAHCRVYDGGWLPGAHALLCSFVCLCLFGSMVWILIQWALSSVLSYSARLRLPESTGIKANSVSVAFMHCISTFPHCVAFPGVAHVSCKWASQFSHQDRFISALLKLIRMRRTIPCDVGCAYSPRLSKHVTILEHDFQTIFR